MTNKTKHYALISMAAVSLAVLTGCSGGDQQPGQINNDPTNTAQASASASDQARQAEDQQVASQVVQITETTKDTAPQLLKQSNQAVKDNILNPYYSGESSAMQWVTLLGLGAHVDKDSITVDGDSFTAHIVDDHGKELADISGVMRDGKIKPTDYYETDDGESFRSDHVQEVASWATN